MSLRLKGELWKREKDVRKEQEASANVSVLDTLSTELGPTCSVRLFLVHVSLNTPSSSFNVPSPSDPGFSDGASPGSEEVPFKEETPPRRPKDDRDPFLGFFCYLFYQITFSILAVITW